MKSFSFLRVLAFFAMVCFARPLFAAGYTCTMTYNSCNSGYYMSTCSLGGGPTTPSSGNSCLSCPANYSCAGGLTCPQSASVSCAAGTYGPSCTPCEDGYYCPGFSNVSSPSAYHGRYACSDLGGASPSGGTYSSASPRSASSYCRYVAPSKSIAGCYSVTTNMISYSGSAWGTTTYTVSANAGYVVANNGTSSATCNGVGYGYFQGTNGTSSTSGTACPPSYPNTDTTTAVARTQCYSGTQWRSWTGSQIPCTQPENSYSYSCNSCSLGSCAYVAYSNSAGNGDGTLYSGCSTNNSSCSQTVASGTVTCASNYYSTGTSCPSCSSFSSSYPYSDSGTSDPYYCYGEFTKYGDRINPQAPSGCDITTTDCTPGTCQYYVHYNGAIRQDCTASSCTNTITGYNASYGYYKTSATTCGLCPTGYQSGSGAASQSGCQAYCPGGQYIPSTYGTCTSVGNGYWSSGQYVNYGSTSSRTLCPAGYRDGVATTAQNGCTASCAGGEYVPTLYSACTSVGTGYYRAAHTVNYGSTSTRTQCSNANYRMGPGASSNAGCQTLCSGGTYVASTNAACSTVGTGYWSAEHYVNFGSLSTTCATQGCTTGNRNYCPTGYQIGAATTAIDYCEGTTTIEGTRNAPTLPTNCSNMDTAQCTPGTCSGKKNYAGTITQSCSASSCTNTITALYANANYYANGTASCTSCSTATSARYPYSAGGNINIQGCYSDTKSRSWSGTQNPCSLPSGCATKTCNSCSGAACDYVAYSNASGTADGTLKSGCASNTGACEQTVASVTASAGYYKATAGSTSCTSCSSSLGTGYTSAADAVTPQMCYLPIAAKNVRSGTTGTALTACGTGTYIGAHNEYYGTSYACDACTNKPANSVYTGNAATDSCPWDCAGGYAETSAGTCAGICTAGIKTLNLGNGVSVPLYSTKQTSPALAVQYNATTCYGSLESGAGNSALNINYSSGTFHTTY